jgi:aminoglycoside phosphotransferase (APT) family kinase protein
LAKRRQDWAERLGLLLRDARQQAAQAQPVALRPIHRDFYHDHLLRGADGPCLIDLDLICLGDPAVDIGNFNAHLTEQALREHGDPHRFGWWQARFAGAACRAPHGPRPGNGRIYEFLSLIRLVEIAERMPERRASAEPLLALCESIVNATPAHSRSPI